MIQAVHDVMRWIDRYGEAPPEGLLKNLGAALRLEQARTATQLDRDAETFLEVSSNLLLVVFDRGGPDLVRGVLASNTSLDDWTVADLRRLEERICRRLEQSVAKLDKVTVRRTGQ